MMPFRQDEIALNRNYFVKARDGVWRGAEVLESRLCSDAPEEGEVASSETVQYYVHYNGLNRRLDEWVDASRIDTTQGCNVESTNYDYMNILNDDPFRKVIKLTFMTFNSIFRSLIVVLKTSLVD